MINAADSTTVSRHEPYYFDAYFPASYGDSKMRTAEGLHGRITTLQLCRANQVYGCQNKISHQFNQEKGEGVESGPFSQNINWYLQSILPLRLHVLHHPPTLPFYNVSNIPYAFKKVGDNSFGCVADYIESGKE